MPNSLRCLLTLFSLLASGALGAPTASPADEAYRDARADYSVLKSDPAKKKFRHHWLNAAHKFEKLAVRWPKSDRAPEALFTAAELYAELSRFSKDAEDLASSEGSYRKVIAQWPKHRLSDDAALGLGRLLFERQEDPLAARKVLEAALDSGGGDRKAELKRLLGALPEPKEKAPTVADAIRKTGRKDEEPKKALAADDGEDAPLSPAQQRAAELVRVATRCAAAGEPGVAQVKAEQERAAVAARQGPAAKSLPAGKQGPEQLKAEQARLAVKVAAAELEAEAARAGKSAARLGDDDEGATAKPVHARRLPALRPEGDGEEAREEGAEAKGGALDALKLPRLSDLQEKLRDVRVGATPPPIRVADSVARARLKQAAKDGAKSELTLAEQLGLKMRRVVIDAGHGGHDSGAIGPTGVQEKDVTLAIAQQLAKKLEAAGLEVLLSRDDDTFVRLEDRAAFANQHKGDLFVSIHCNAAPTRSLRGIETYTLNTSADRYSIRLAARENASSEKGVSDLQFILADLATKANTEESSRLAQRVQKSLVRDLSATHKGVRDLGTKEALFFVLLGARMPAILVETSFLSHPEEEKLLGSEAYQGEVAASIADAVTGFLEEREAKLARID